MPFAPHYAHHIERLCSLYEQALAEVPGHFEAVVLHSGSEQFFYADDQAAPFRAYGHFAHWLPVNRPDQLLLIRPGKRPVYFQICPRDFWYEQDDHLDDWVAAQFDVQVFSDSGKAAASLSSQLPGVAAARIAFLGEESAWAETAGIPPGGHNPPALLRWLDYQRAFKSPYEAACIRHANRHALTGHTAARHAFLDGGSEYDIHMAYLQACRILDDETPYTNIVALDEKAAILHYQNKRRSPAPDSQVLLLDAGCRSQGYCSDITRTSTRPHTPALFVALVEAMQTLQTDLIETVAPGVPYPDIHAAAQRGICRILLDHDICHGSLDTLVALNMGGLFMPHGVGHLLGIQVHDVGGKQIDVRGAFRPAPADHPALRTTRTLEESQVFTIEPGLYFIPQLLDYERAAGSDSARAGHINWRLVESLLPLGGIRIEDNVMVTPTGVENLTRVLI